MFKVVVPKDKLLEVLKSNRQFHRSDFLEALEGYQKFAEAQFIKWLEQVRSNTPDKITSHFSFDVPKDHTEEYDRAIAMVTMADTDSIEIGEEEFSHYVEDDWDWKRQFAATTDNYKNFK